MSEFSPQVQNVLHFLQEYSGGKLRKPQDLGGILDTAEQYGLAEQMNDLIFCGAAVWRVYRALQKMGKSGVSPAQLEAELHRLIAQFQKLMERILSHAPESFRIRCQKIYITAPGAARNIIDLAFDLSILHDVQRQARDDHRQ